jgi:uncharacterized membrane protein
MSTPILRALPELVREGLLSEEDAVKINAYYAAQKSPQGQRINIVFGIIGSVLVGMGIILILAHNWDEMNRMVKVVFAFLPLLIGQLFCGYSLLKKGSNSTWKESSASFLFFAVGASIALVAQIYNIPGDLSSFLYTWMLLCVPLMYIMSSSIVSLLFLAGVTAYGVADGYGYQSPHANHYFWIILLAIPYYFQSILRKPGSNFTLFQHWFFPLSITICLGTLAVNAGEYMVIAYMSMFGVFYLLGTSTWFSFKRLLSNSYLIIGSLGTMSILLALSFKWFWETLANENQLLSVSEWGAIIVPTVLAFFLLYKTIINRHKQAINPMGFIFAAFIIIFLIGREEAFVAAILMNLLVLAAAILTIRRGHLLNHLGILNYGLLIIAALVVCRFFDTNISFVLRGLMFVAVGAGFFFANSRLLQKRKVHEQ